MNKGGRMHFDIEFPHKLASAYNEMCKPLCQKLKLPQTAFDILMFLSNNPQYTSARDIVEVRKLKANLVSINIDKLVKEGYLIRKEVEGDRRKTALICTSKANEIVKVGRNLQEKFIDTLFEGLDKEDQEVMGRIMNIMESNIDRILEDYK